MNLLHDTMKKELETTPFSSNTYHAFLEDIFSLLAELIENQGENNIVLYEKFHNASKEDYPFFVFKKAFSLSEFQMYCVLLGLFCYHQKNQYTQKTMNDIYDTPIATISVVMSLYPWETGGLDVFSIISKEMTETFQSFFMINDKDVFPLDFVLILKHHLLSYLLQLTPTYTLPLIHSNVVSFRQCSEQESFAEKSLSFVGYKNTMVQISGKPTSGRLHVAEKLLLPHGKNILLIAVHTYYSNVYLATKSQLYEIYHQCMLQNAIPCVYGMEEILKLKDREKRVFCMEFFHFFKEKFPYFFTITELHIDFTKWIPKSITVLHYESSGLSYHSQVSLWKEKTKELPLAPDVDFHTLVNRFQFSAREITERITQAKHIAMLSSEIEVTEITQHHLEQACNSFSTKLQELGTELIQSNYTWEDLILTHMQKQLLQHACNYVKLQHLVYETWQFNQLHTYGKNLSILLEGVSGTGKTMTAQVIANQLNMALFKLDIPKVTSRYIGESEKKMNEIFNEAEKCNAIIFIDEMESFFGKRTEIKDAHEKYANMQTSFLLQKIEDFKGVLLLATNHLEYIDDAFIRRIKFIVSMALPKERERRMLWQSMFPKNAPVSKDIDFDFLAKNFEISGGIIKNIIIKSAFSAYGDNSVITMQHILQSLKYELSKQGNILVDSDFSEYSYLL